MNDDFEFIETPYSLRIKSHFWSKMIRTTKCGIEAASYIGPKAIKSLKDSMSKRKIWVPENCPCRLYT